MDRVGAPLVQRREPFVLVRPSGATARILSLFAVSPAAEATANWSGTGDRFRIRTTDGEYGAETVWRVALP